MRLFSVRYLFLPVVLLFSCSAFAKQEKFVKPGPVQLTSEGNKWAEKTLKKLSLEEKIGQMIQVRAFADFLNVDSDEYKHIRDEVKKYHLGSVLLTVRVSDGLLIKDLPYEAAAVTNMLQKESKLPLLVAADFERGLSMRLNETPAFPHAMAFGATFNPELEEKFAAITAQESRAIGVHWNYFPDADVNINPANPIINTRSFGEDPVEVGEMVAAYVKGSREYGMLSTAKHFPGHGDTATDSHLGVATVPGNLQRIDSVELPPFEEAVKAGVDSIMVAHVTIPALEPDPNKVATTSHKVVTDLLKDQFHFQGLIVTDALEMHGLTRLYPENGPNPSGRAAVDAVKAGNDMVLLPSDLDGAFNGLLQAAKDGEISKAQIDASVLKVLRAKASLGLNKARLVDMEQIPHIVSRPESLDFAQQVADAATTLVRDNGQALPFPKSPGTAQGPPSYLSPGTVSPGTAASIVAVVITDDVRGEYGRVFELEMRKRVHGARIFFVDSRTAGPMAPEIVDAARQAQKVVVAAYVVPTAAKQTMVNGQLTNTVGLNDATGTLMQQLLDAAATKTVVIAMGNPYLAMSFPAVQTYICTYSNAPTSDRSAVKVLFGEMQTKGRLPVSLPGIAERGFGLEMKPGELQAAEKTKALPRIPRVITDPRDRSAANPL
ncbi:MAG TPA: glycoside hydrolase family 3 N-terminal domain-containing protein [Terriglobales bacterium]|nr:glycoside hydrolase family 3 N-terminal domain-containing protein [Terriglobales bacterium]